VAPGETPADNAFHEEVISGAGGTDAHSEIELPVRRDVEVNGGKNCCCWSWTGVEVRDGTEGGIVFMPAAIFLVKS